MATSTTTFGLTKPAVNSATDADLWGGELNTDLDNIDAILKASLNWVYTAKVASFAITAPTAASATIADAKKLFVCDATGGAIVPTLPAAASSTNMVVGIKKKDSTANAVTVTANGAELIDGANTFAISAQYGYVLLVCDGTGWQVISKSSASNSGKISPVSEITDSTDITVATLASVSNVGSTATVTIPTKGLIKIFATAEVSTGGGSYTLVFGIAISGTNYLPLCAGTVTTYGFNMASGTGHATDIYKGTTGIGAVSSLTANTASQEIIIDIEASGIPTGSQTIQAIAGTNFGSPVLKGTIVTTKVYLSLYDHS